MNSHDYAKKDQNDHFWIAYGLTIFLESTRRSTYSSWLLEGVEDDFIKNIGIILCMTVFICIQSLRHTVPCASYTEGYNRYHTKASEGGFPCDWVCHHSKECYDIFFICLQAHLMRRPLSSLTITIILSLRTLQVI